jgi:hypothetical protein
MQGQQRQQRARLRTAELEHTTVQAHLKGTEDPELHDCHATLLAWRDMSEGFRARRNLGATDRAAYAGLPLLRATTTL